MTILGQFKKGIYTSEFWLVLIAGVWTAIQQGYQPDRSFSEQAINLALIGGAAAYGFGRSYLKGKRVIATAVVSTGQAPAQISKTLQVDEEPATPTDTTTPPTTQP
jgi:hypothetical protein